MSYTISILCFNRLEMTRRCLQSVLRHLPPSAQVIVTDNGSTDGTWDYLQSLRGDRRLEFVRNSENQGLTRPKNRALALARWPYFVSLDNDAVVDGRGWLESMRGALDHAPASSPPVAQVGWRAPHVSCALRDDGLGYPDHDHVEYIEGSVMMVRSDLAAQAGGICDPIYPFAYCEDADLSLRLRMRGYGIVTIPLPVSHPPESDKLDHGGVDLGEHHRLQHFIFTRRWRYYLRHRRFDWKVGLLARSARAAERVEVLIPLLQAQMPAARIGVVPYPLDPAQGYSFDLDRGQESAASLVGRLNAALPVTFGTAAVKQLHALPVFG